MHHSSSLYQSTVDASFHFLKSNQTKSPTIISWLQSVLIPKILLKCNTPQECLENTSAIELLGLEFFN